MCRGAPHSASSWALAARGNSFAVKTIRLTIPRDTMLKKALMAASAKAVRTQLPAKVVARPGTTPSAYLLFGKDERPNLTGKPQEIMRELGRRWKGLDDAAKKPYHDDALKLKGGASTAGTCAAKRSGPQPLITDPPRRRRGGPRAARQG